MGAPFARRRSGPRTADEGRELALDLTADEIVLHRGSAATGWHRFAGVAVDDPEFLAVIGLLRAEAEAALGGPAPVRLWLPPEQVLAVTMPIAATGPEARLRAAFEGIGDATGHAPDAVALAVAPAGRAAATRLLVTYAETLREARNYAARWGFTPGPVSTRHHAEAFAPAEPVFRLRATVAKPAPAGGRRAPRMALGVACAALVLAAHPADAARAPGAAPLPPARAEAGGADATAAGPGGPSLRALVPPPRSDGREGDSPAEEAGREAGGLVAPLPVARPDRPAASAPRARATSLAAIGAAAPPPVRRAASGRGLPLDRVALIGVLNLESGRKALLRLPDGAFRSVSVGDAIDGWRVSAIGVDAMRVSRGGEERTLLLVTR